MSEHERESKKVKTTKKLHALKTKAEAVTKKLRNEVDKAVHDICEKVGLYMHRIPYQLFLRYVYKYK